MSGFGQPPGGGFGQPPGSGFGQPPGGGFGQPPGDAPGGGEAPLARVPFTAEDEANISSMARFMFATGAVNIVLGLLNLVVSILQAVLLHAPAAQIGGRVCGGLFVTGISVALAYLLFQSSKAFKEVVRTDTADQEHLVAGLGKLKSYFLFKGILYILVLVLVCLCCGAGMLGAAALLGSRG